MSYAQGFMLMREAAKQFKWNLNYGGIALMWRGGCIIRRYAVHKFPQQCTPTLLPELDSMNQYMYLGEL